MGADSSSRSSPAITANDLIGLVEAVPGVHGIEAGIATTLRSLDARLRRRPEHARLGLTIDPDGPLVTVELALSGARPVRSVVEDVQHAVHKAIASSGSPPHEVLVRVQSLG